MEDCVRYSKMDAPERPAGYDLEPVRGAIQWPPVLKEGTFLEQRIQLDCLFAQRSRAEGAAGRTFAALAACVRQCRTYRLSAGPDLAGLAERVRALAGWE